jgi:type III secretion protein T
MLQALFNYFQDQFLAVALVLPRIAAAFVMLPLFTQDNVPALVRNSFMVSLSVIVAALVSQTNPAALMGQNMLLILMVKEFFLGIMIGFCFAGIFWAIGIAGNLIDTKVGTTMASILDPIQGHQTSLSATFLSQFATWLFMASGGFMIFLDILLGSYALWPVTSYFPDFTPGGQAFVISQFSYIMTTAFIFAAPALVVMAVIDVGLGLMNRFAQQLNLFSLTTPIKSLISTFMLILLLGFYVEFVIRSLFAQKGLLNALDAVM